MIQQHEILLHNEEVKCNLTDLFKSSTVTNRALIKESIGKKIKDQNKSFKYKS